MVAFVGISNFLSGGQIKNFVELKKALEAGKTVSFISKRDQIDPTTEKHVIKEIGYHISDFIYEGTSEEMLISKEVIRTSKKMIVSKGDKYEMVVILPTFKSDDSVSIEVNSIDPKTKNETEPIYTYTGKINNGSNSGAIHLCTIE